MITIRNTQRSVSIDVAELRKHVEIILRELKYEDFDLGIWLTSNTTIRAYNRTYRDKDKATDILSFPFYPDLKPGERIHAASVEEKNLGDIIIAPTYVRDDAPRWDSTFEERMKVLLVHGICHLLGYDHIEDADFKVMQRKEKSLLKKLES